MKEKNADKIYVNGIIITLDAANRFEQALAVKNDKILTVGKNEDVMAYVTPDTKVVDLDGKTMIPGFYDSHGHFSFAGEELLKVNLSSPPVGTKTCIADYIAALKEKAQKTPPGEWILATGYDDTLIEEMRHPTRHELDQASTEHPIWIVHVSYHMGVANSKALEIRGVTKDTIAPEGGLIAKDSETGELNGLMEETAMSLIHDINLELSQKERMELFALASKEYARQGVTTASDSLVKSLHLIDDYQEAAAKKYLSVRVVLNPSYDIAEEIRNIKSESGLLSMGGVKIVYDGSIQAYTAYLSKPYYKLGGRAPDYRGYPWMSIDELKAKVKKMHNLGFQCLIHGNGDMAIGDILHAYKVAQKENPRQDTRHVVIHCQTVREEQLDEIQALDVIPSFFALHTYYWGDRHRDIFLGTERAFRIDPCNSAVERNIIFTIHCDTPVVPQNPLLSMYAAVNRISSKGNLIGAEQRITALEALRASTINAAIQNFEENIKGSLEPGKLADLVILEDNPLDCKPERIKDIRVLETIVGGETVYQALT